jgi:hypothetical protein
MPRYRITVADCYTVDVDAPTRKAGEEMARAQSHAILEYDEQRILAILRLEDEEDMP